MTVGNGASRAPQVDKMANRCKQTTSLCQDVQKSSHTQHKSCVNRRKIVALASRCVDSKRLTPGTAIASRARVMSRLKSLTTKRLAISSTKLPLAAPKLASGTLNRLDGLRLNHGHPRQRTRHRACDCRPCFRGSIKGCRCPGKTPRAIRLGCQ